MNESPRRPAAWPFVRLAMPPSVDDDQLGLVTQAAVEAGALGGAVDHAHLDLYLPPDQSEASAAALRRAVEDQAARLGWPLSHWRVESLPDAPWATAWMDDFRSTPVGERLLVRPEWELGAPPADPAWNDRIAIGLRPGLGFGTGRHETTRLALEALERHLKPGMTVLDFGSGSGLLAIAAARLGAACVLAVECDRDAVANARDNLALNPAAGPIVTILESDRPAALPGPVDLAVCNMLPHEFLPQLPDLVRCLKDTRSVLIYSGFLADQTYEIETALTRAGLSPVECAKLGEWACRAARPAA
jgi:ribosomal protein L11 methyltransferase